MSLTANLDTVNGDVSELPPVCEAATSDPVEVGDGADDDHTDLMQRRWEFLLPCSFNALQVLPPKLWSVHQYACYLVNVIIRKTMQRKVDRKGYAHLHSRLLRKVIPTRHCGPIIRALKAAQVLVISPHRANHWSRGYRLHERFLDDRTRRYTPTDKALLRRLAKVGAEMKERQQARRLDIHSRLNTAQYEFLTVDLPEAEALLADLPRHTLLCQDALVQNLVRRKLTNSVSSTRRWFNALTGVKKGLRAALRIAGEPLANVDLVCCQPALLAWLAQLAFPSAGANCCTTYKVPDRRLPAEVVSLLASLPVGGPSFRGRDVPSFVDLSASGRLYERLQELSGLNRGTVKRRFLVDVLACRGRYRSSVRDCFAAAFPSVAELIRVVNLNDYARLIRLLQRLESWLVIEQVCPRLVDRCPIVPLHDAIYCRAGDLPLVESAFREVFEEIGFSMTLKRDYGEMRKADARADGAACWPVHKN